MRGNWAGAQYVPIPNYTGIGAGEQFRNDLNNHLSGVTAIAPRLVPFTFAQLPEEQNGQLYWCEDCEQTNPCAGGGSGSIAIGESGVWDCSLGSGGSGLSAVTHDSTVQGAGTSSSPLSIAATTLNQLSEPTTGLQMNGQEIVNMAPALSASEALAYAQTNAEVTHNQPGIVVVSSSNFESGSAVKSATITAPAGIANGDALVLFATVADGPSSETWTAPTGFSQVGINIVEGTDDVAAQFCKTAASESGNYTIGFSNAGVFLGGMVVLSGTNCSQIDQNFGATAASSSAAFTGIQAMQHENDLIIAQGQGFGASSIIPSQGTDVFYVPASGYVASYFVNPYGTPALSYSTGGTATAVAGTAMAFYPASTITAAPILHGSSGGVVADLQGSFNQVINVQSPSAVIAGGSATITLGATGDGNHDDTAAIQNAVDAACGMTGYATTALGVHAGHPRVLLPYSGPNGCYKITQPIRLFCGGLDFGSDPNSNVWGAHAKLCPNFAGPALVAEAPAQNNLTYASSLISGTGNSFNTTGAGTLVLSDWLNSSLADFNANTQIGVEMVVNLSGLGSTGQLWQWRTASPGSSNMANNPIAQMSVNSSGQTFCSIDTTSSGYVSGTSTDTGFTLNANHTMSYDWNGSDLYCFRDGVLVVGPLAATGSLYTSTASGSGLFATSDEPEQDTNYWPDVQPLQSSGIQGKIDAINISKVALHTAAYTPATSKPGVNANTQLLINFEGTCTTADQSGCSPDGMQLAHTGLYNDGSGQMNVYLPVRGVNGTVEIPSIHVHDLELCPGTHVAANDGLFAIWAQQSEFDHLSCANVNDIGFNFFDNDFEASTHDIQVGGTGHPLGFEFGLQYNESHDSNLFDSGGQVMSVSNSNGGTFDQYLTHAGQGHDVYDWIYNSTKFTSQWPFSDEESAAPNHLADFHIDNGSFGGLILDGQYNTRNGAPYIDNWGGYAVTVIGSEFDTFGASTVAAEIFNHVDAESNNHYPASPDVIINGLIPLNGSTEIPLSNPAGWVLDLGDSNGGEAKAVWHGTIGGGAPAVPACNSGIDGHTFRVSDGGGTASSPSCAANASYAGAVGSGRCEVSCRSSIPGYVYTGVLW
ncbi:MAG TPA: hypothetical protein VMF50_06425 [Candidatus Binataceae bacterium]|nr:hypothetical protein [Candidatus Binataceae bacterium]